MGIRKGWALCGAGERRRFISHAVSSHPLLELQTPGLLALSSAHHQDLLLDSIQKKKKNPPPFSPLHPYLSLFFFSSFFFFFRCSLPRLPPPSRLLTGRRELFWRPLPFVSLAGRGRDRRFRQVLVVVGGQRTAFSSPTPVFLSLLKEIPQPSLLTASLWISLLILHMQII